MDSVRHLPSHWRFTGFRPLFASAAVGVGAVLLAAPLTALSYRMFHKPHELPLSASLGFVLLLTVPVEEWLFRGVVLRQLLRFGAPLAVLVSAAVAAAAHGSLARFLPLLAVGVVVGVIYVRTLSLWPCIVAHCTYDAAAVTIALLAGQR